MLVKEASEIAAEEIARGRLNNTIATIAGYVEDIKSTRDQIALLELLLKNIEKEGDSLS